MLHKITIEFDTSNGQIAVDTGDLPADQALGLMNTARKKIRQAEGVLEVLVTKDMKTQVVSTDFQSDEILQWSELLGMLRQSEEEAVFRQRMQMGAAVQQNAMAQAQNHHLAQQVVRQLAAPGGKLILGG